MISKYKLARFLLVLCVISNGLLASNKLPEDFFINEIDSHDNIEILAFEDALENDSIGLTTKEAQNDASNDD